MLLLTSKFEVEPLTVMSTLRNVPSGTVTANSPSAIFSTFVAPATLPPVRTNVTVGSVPFVFTVICFVPSEASAFTALIFLSSASKK